VPVIISYYHPINFVKCKLSLFFNEEEIKVKEKVIYSLMNYTLRFRSEHKLVTINNTK